MKHKDKLLLPMMFAAALVAAPALAQSPGAQGGATGATGTSTAQGTTGSTPGSTMGTMHSGAANSVVMARPRLSQLIGTNVYNDRNETIGEVDDVILAPPGMAGSPSMGSASPPIATTPGSTTSGNVATPATPGMGSSMPGMSAGAMHGPMAVIQIGGFLGMGGRLVMVPLSELQWNAERERIIMPNASKELLQGRPAFSYDSLRRG